MPDTNALVPRDRHELVTRWGKVGAAARRIETASQIEAVERKADAELFNFSSLLACEMLQHGAELGVILASEMKQLVAGDPVKAEICASALDEYARFMRNGFRSATRDWA